MIYFTDRGYKTVAIADTDSPDGLRLLSDELNTEIKTGTSIYKANIDKNHPTIESIEVGCFVFVPNFRNKMVVVEIMEVEETRTTKKIIAEDAGMSLINSDASPYKMKGTLREHVSAILGENSGWEIGADEIGDTKNLTLEYDGITTKTKRLQQVAGRFGAEIDYSFDFAHNSITKKKVNLYKRRGQNVGRRLEVGKELKDVKRHVSLTNLMTAVRGIGQNHKEDIKVKKEVKKPIQQKQTQSTVMVNDKIEKFIGWFKAREGKVRYSMGSRMGPNSYDCSSAVFFAAKHAGLIPQSQWIGNTETLFSFNGKYLKEISRSEVKRGDIFVSGVQGGSSGAAGHTGAIIDYNTIIHCTYSRNGIATTPLNGWTGQPCRYFRWTTAGEARAQGSSGGAGRYWTNNQLIHHDLGFKLNTLTAQQINNWVKATSPDSPFNGQGNVFIEAQRQSGLDARYILAHAALESAWGKSNIARNYNNYFGIGAFDSNPDNARNYSNPGLASGIISGANWIAKNYYNGKWKQTTLYKMRHNNGVHQYATDPAWHTKIANIMKRSERFTTPSTAQKPKQEYETVIEYETKEIEKETTLVGYNYDDGRFFVDKKRGILCDRQANEIWGEDGRYITRVYKSQAKSNKTLFDECMNQLKNNNEPEVTYEVSPLDIPDDVSIGDTVRIIDHDYNPPLYLEARLVEMTTSTVTPTVDKAKFSNFVEKKAGINERLSNLQAQLDEQRWRFDDLPYIMELTSASGSVFKDGNVTTTLMASLTKGGIEQSANVDGFVWERVSAYPDKLVVSDETWNEEHAEYNEHVLDLGNSDVELEATFTCTAMLNGVAVAVASYTIKNLSIGIYIQEAEPNRNAIKWGDVWQYDSGDGTHWKRVWKGNRWEDTVTKRDLEAIELTPGPQGAPGKDGAQGLPGKDGEDGKTSYVHFAYADSSDGTIGFTTTATQGKKYIGIYTDFTKDDSTNPADYSWSKYVGEDGDQGIPGKTGEDGKTPYFHTAWATSSTGANFSVKPFSGASYMGTCTTFSANDPTNPGLYDWQLTKGAKGDTGATGAQGVPGKDGAPGKDGKTGQLGKNLLRRSNVKAENITSYLVKDYELAEPIEDGEQITVTIKAMLGDRATVVIATGGGSTLGKLYKTSNGWSVYSSTIRWRNSGSKNNKLEIYMQDDSRYNGGSKSASIDWVVLARGDVPALDWYPCDADTEELISSKADQIALNAVRDDHQALKVHFESFPEEVNKNSLAIARQEAYIEKIKNAADSTDTALSDRIAIIENSVGAGKATLSAINTYLEFGEEGVLIGKQGEQIRTIVKNDALEILEGDKVVAKFGNNQAEVVNLKVDGIAEMGYHTITKIDLNGKRYTGFRPL